MQWLLLIFFVPYLILLLRIYINLKKIKPYSQGKAQGIFISVIIACRNEERNLPELLNSISEQDYDPELFELIIVDDNSTDLTFIVASEFSKIRNLKVLKNKGTGKKQAIRTGIKTSSGNLILTTDADCQMEESWIRTIVTYYSENKPDLIICPVRLESKTGLLNRFQEIEFLSLQGVTAGTAAGGRPVMCNGANLAFTKESYNRHSTELHDELVSGDDIFLLLALKNEKGSKILWLESPDSLVITKLSETVNSFLKQRSRWISKAGAYNDSYTMTLAIVTFVTILLQWFLLISGIFSNVLFMVFLVSLLVKSIPDFLILQNTAKRYKRKKLLGIFIPAQLIYPLYIIALFFNYLIKGRKYHNSL